MLKRRAHERKMYEYSYLYCSRTEEHDGAHERGDEGERGGSDGHALARHQVLLRALGAPAVAQRVEDADAQREHQQQREHHVVHPREARQRPDRHAGIRTAHSRCSLSYAIECTQAAAEALLVN